ncbi:hypothetical protein RB653_003595 [Dictyostelium firmibasis]|uniref:PH domain-containing protein n=1 Tax=Dictyostelium firmibasis TaxID=79012 RepID=A0AAN7TY49_9MYCE
MYCGYIYKLGQFLYKKRYFEIIDCDGLVAENQEISNPSPKLCYYDNENKKFQRGSIEIQDILYFNISKQFSFNHGNVFGFELTTPGRVYSFYTNTESERIFWIEAITTISSKIKQNKIDSKINDSKYSPSSSLQSPQLSIKNEEDKENNFNENIKEEQLTNTKNNENHKIEYMPIIYDIYNLIDTLNNKKLKLLNIQIINKKLTNENQDQLTQYKNQLLEIQFKINSIIYPLIKSELKTIKINLNNVSTDNNSFSNETNKNNENRLLEILNENVTLNNIEIVINNENPIVKNSKDQLIIKLKTLKQEIKESNNNFNSLSIKLFKINKKISENLDNNNRNYNDEYIIEDNEINQSNILKIFFNDNIINKKEEFFKIKKDIELKVKEYDEKILKFQNESKNNFIKQVPSELLNEIKEIIQPTLDHFNKYLNFIKLVLELKNQCLNIKPTTTTTTINDQKNNISQLDLMVESLIKKLNNNNFNDSGIKSNNGRCCSVGSDRSSTESIRSSLTSSLSNLSVSATATTTPCGKWVIPSNFKKISQGLYQFGTKRINASIRDSDGNLVVRVGGGYLLFVDFVYKYGERESLKLKS